MFNKLDRIQAQDLFETYSPYVYRVALFISKSKVLADDITQETFIRIYEKYDTYNKERPIEPWIYQITLNVSRNLLRKRKWLSFLSKVPEREVTETIESHLVKNEEDQALWNEINKLSNKYQEIIILHYYTGLKHIEIAEVLGIPVGTCKSRLHTATKQLRKNLSGHQLFKSYGGESVEIS